MTGKNTSALIAPNEGPVAHVCNADGDAAMVLVCEHASSFIPVALDELSLAAEARFSHIAWDIGAYDLALALSRALDAPLVASDISRLVFDCNRPLEDASATPAVSEIYSVPGNSALSAEQRRQRYDEVYLPFEKMVAQQISKQSKKLSTEREQHIWPLPLLVTVHSFTPVYHGQTRDVEIGLLHHDASGFALRMHELANDVDPVANPAVVQGDQNSPAHSMPFKVELNKPYDASDGVLHTLLTHAKAARLAHVMIEVNNELLRQADSVNQVAEQLGSLITLALQSGQRS